MGIQLKLCGICVLCNLSFKIKHNHVRDFPVAMILVHCQLSIMTILSSCFGLIMYAFLIKKMLKFDFLLQAFTKPYWILKAYNMTLLSDC